MRCARIFTLPELQQKLDLLAEGALLQISGWDYERLFGTNDVAASRLRHFRRGIHALPVTPTGRYCFARTFCSATTIRGFDSVCLHSSLSGSSRLTS